MYSKKKFWLRENNIHEQKNDKLNFSAKICSDQNTSTEAKNMHCYSLSLVTNVYNPLSPI